MDRVEASKDIINNFDAKSSEPEQWNYQRRNRLQKVLGIVLFETEYINSWN